MRNIVIGEEFLCQRRKRGLKVAKVRSSPPKKVGPGGYYYARVWKCPNERCKAFNKPYLLETDKRYVSNPAR